MYSQFMYYNTHIFNQISAMIINPNDFIYNTSYNTIIICGDNNFLIDYVYTIIKKYISINDLVLYRSIIIQRNESKWSQIAKVEKHIYIPCYDWNINATYEILANKFSKNIIKYIHYNCTFQISELLEMLNEAEILKFCNIQDNDIIRSPQSVYNDIVNTLITQ